MGQRTFTIRGKELTIERDTTALLVIDMQNDFIHDDGYFGKRAKQLVYDMELRKEAIPCIKRLAQAMREKGVPVIHCPTVWEPDYADCGVPVWLTGEWEETGFLVKGTWGAQIIEELTPQKGDYMVETKCHSKFPYTPLELILRNKGIKTLIFAGVSTSVCVESTIRDATVLGYHCILTSDGTRAGDRQTHEAALERIDGFFGAVMTSDQVMKLFGKTQP